MAPAKIVELIESLAPEDQMKVVEYIQLLHLKDAQIDPDLDERYRQYILDGINRGMEDLESGRIYTTEEAKKRLSELLQK